MLFLERLLNIVGLDKAVSVTLLARVWTIVGGLGTLFFLTHYLSLELQGYYYTFNSLIGLQVLVELGLNFAIIQFASHEMAKLKWGDDGVLTGDLQAKRRLQSLMQFAFAWFGAAALVVLVLLLPAGIFFFHIAAPPGGQIRPEWAWALAAFFTAIAFLVNAALAIIEGCNKIAEVAAIRFAQMFCSQLAVWVALGNGAGLYALAIGGCVMASVGAVALFVRHRQFFRDLGQFSTDLPGIHWKEEIWPFQWRIAVSWASGYLIFQIFNPMLFATHGPIAAGRMGMSLQIISAMNGAAMVWITVKAPLLGQFVAQNNRTALERTLRTALLQSTIFLLGGIAAVLMALLWLQASYPAYAIRVLPPIYFAVLCLACFANHIVFSEAAYLRAHKEEPLMGISVVNGIATALLAALLIPPFSYAGAVAAYSVGAIIIGFLGCTIVFVRKRRVWLIRESQITR